MKKSGERLAVYIFGVVFVALIVVAAFIFPHPTQFQYTVFRIVLSLACAGIAAFIPGFIEVNLKNWIRAGGAIAVFVVVYFFDPAQLVLERPPISGVVLGPREYPPDSIIELVPTSDQLEAPARLPPDEVSFSVRNLSGEDLKLFTYDFSAKQRSGDDAFARQSFWVGVPLPSNDNFVPQGRFKKTNGWFGFAVGRYREDGESVEAYFLATKDLFYSRSPALTVVRTSDPQQPFDAEFCERGNE